MRFELLREIPRLQVKRLKKGTQLKPRLKPLLKPLQARHSSGAYGLAMAQSGRKLGNLGSLEALTSAGQIRLCIIISHVARHSNHPFYPFYGIPVSPSLMIDDGTLETCLPTKKLASVVLNSNVWLVQGIMRRTSNMLAVSGRF